MARPTDPQILAYLKRRENIEPSLYMTVLLRQAAKTNISRLDRAVWAPNGRALILTEGFTVSPFDPDFNFMLNWLCFSLIEELDRVYKRWDDIWMG